LDLLLRIEGAVVIAVKAANCDTQRTACAKEQTMNEKNDIEETIDIEIYAKEGKEPPFGNKIKYRVRIDDKHYIIDHREPTGRELLLVAGKNPPEGFRLDQKLHGGATKKIELDERVDLAKPGVERFMTIPLDATEG
jgi:hypothetical protein